MADSVNLSFMPRQMMHTAMICQDPVVQLMVNVFLSSTLRFCHSSILTPRNVNLFRRVAL